VFMEGMDVLCGLFDAVSCIGDVVRHLLQHQGNCWGMPPDFAFCFAERHVDGQHFDAIFEPLLPGPKIALNSRHCASVLGLCPAKGPRPAVMSMSA